MVQLLGCLLHYFCVCSLGCILHGTVCVCVCVRACARARLCMCDRERDMPFEVTLVAQRVKAALPVGLS